MKNFMHILMRQSGKKTILLSQLVTDNQLQAAGKRLILKM